MKIAVDGHTLGPMVADLEKFTGVEARRIHVDKGTSRRGSFEGAQNASSEPTADQTHSPFTM